MGAAKFFGYIMTNSIVSSDQFIALVGEGARSVYPARLRDRWCSVDPDPFRLCLASPSRLTSHSVYNDTLNLAAATNAFNALRLAPAITLTARYGIPSRTPERDAADKGNSVRWPR